MQKKYASFIFTLMIFPALILSCDESSAQTGKGVPQHIKQLVFDDSEFSRPITVNLPPQDGPAENKYIYSWYNAGAKGSMPPIPSFTVQNMNKGLLNFLSKNEYAVIDVLHTPHQLVYKKYEFISYTDAIKPFIATGTFKGGFTVNLASRVLKSIDYTNQYEAIRHGIKIKVFALTFTYTITEKMHGLPRITKHFEGKARAYLDPDDGKWKVDEITFADNGAEEYWAVLRSGR